MRFSEILRSTDRKEPHSEDFLAKLGPVPELKKCLELLGKGVFNECLRFEVDADFPEPRFPGLTFLGRTDLGDFLAWDGEHFVGVLSDPDEISILGIDLESVFNYFFRTEYCPSDAVYFLSDSLERPTMRFSDENLEGVAKFVQQELAIKPVVVNGSKVFISQDTKISVSLRLSEIQLFYSNAEVDLERLMQLKLGISKAAEA